MTRKLDKEHLDAIQELRANYAKNSSTLGSIAIELHVLNRQLELMNEEQTKYLDQFEALRKQEADLLQKMRDRYGEGQIDINDGTFMPDSGLEQ
jgi:septation ring formation regulator EzrA